MLRTTATMKETTLPLQPGSQNNVYHLKKSLIPIEYKNMQKIIESKRIELTMIPSPGSSMMQNSSSSVTCSVSSVIAVLVEVLLPAIPADPVDVTTISVLLPSSGKKNTSQGPSDPDLSLCWCRVPP